MPEHANVAPAGELGAAFARGDLEAIERLMADDVVWHEIGRAEPRRGKQALRESAAGADYGITGETPDIVDNDDHVGALVDATATRGGRNSSTGRPRSTTSGMVAWSSVGRSPTPRGRSSTSSPSETHWLSVAGRSAPLPVGPLRPDQDVIQGAPGEWNRWTNTTGLVVGVANVGEELRLLHSAGVISASSVRERMDWVWNGTEYPPA